MAKGMIRERGKNVYQIIYDAPKGLDGKRNRKYITFHGGKREAEKKS